VHRIYWTHEKSTHGFGRMKRVIVSGGNGFIGSSLVKRLLGEGVEVHALVNENFQRLKTISEDVHIHELRGELQSAVEIVDRVQPDTIFHLAAVYQEPVSADCVLSMINGNLTLGACLLFAATQCARQPVFVNTGTYWQFDRDAEYAPNTLYAATKHAFQDLLHFYRERNGVASVTLILYETFGGGDTRNKLWRRLVTATEGTRVPLSEGEQQFHLVHIDDVVNAFVLAAQMLHTGEPMEPLYTLHSPSAQKLRPFVEELNRRAELGLELQWGALPYWEGQVFVPWQGQTLPGWTASVDAMTELVALASERKVASGARD